jgi:hypothetical protein
MFVALPGAEPRHGLDEHLDREGLVQHRLRAEPIGLLHRLFVSRANDDRRLGKSLLDPNYQRACATPVVSMETTEIRDDKIGSRVRSRVFKIIDEDQLIALVAQNVANEVSDRAVVFDEQDLSYVRQGGGLLPGAQF